MSTDFTYNDTTISTTGGIEPIVIDTPGDVRTRVRVYADISSIPYPYVGMNITVISDETNGGKMTDYKVKSLKANGLGVPNTVINEVVKMVDYMGVSDIIVELNNTISLLTARIEALENGGGSGSTTTNVTGITLSTNNVSLTTEGQTYTLSYTISPSNATNKNVTWSSSNTGIASVNNGVITAISNGTTTITVTTVDGNHSASCTVTVNITTSSEPETSSYITTEEGYRLLTEDGAYLMSDI